MSKTDIKELLQRIDWLSNIGIKFSFYPNVDKKKKGRASIELYDHKALDAVAEYLGRFGIFFGSTGQKLSNDKAFIEFECDADNEIIAVLEKAAHDTEVNLQVGQLEYLQQEIKNLAKQAAHAKAGVFSRGIKGVQNSVNTLSNVVKIQEDKLK